MKPDLARELLRHHASIHPNFKHPKSELGFLGVLILMEDEGGELKEENFHQVMDCIRCLANELTKEGDIDKDIVASLWSICHLASSWAFSTKITKQNFIIKEQVTILLEWVEIISHATMRLLNGFDINTALEPYRAYKQNSHV